MTSQTNVPITPSRFFRESGMGNRESDAVVIPSRQARNRDRTGREPRFPIPDSRFPTSHSVQELLLERGDGADHASRSQRSRENLAGLDRGAKRATTHLVPERLEEWGTRLRDTAGDHD